MKRPGPASAVAAGFAVALGSTALAGVLEGLRWLWFALLTVGVVVLLGLLPRIRGAPLAVVLAGQLLGLTLLLTALFDEHAVLGVLPGPASVTELSRQLATATGQIENGVPPVPTTSALLLLVCFGFGVLAVGADALTSVGHGTAACGLALLCAFTVPATLAEEALPGWTLAAGALGYAVLLVVEHQRRQALRGVAPPAPRASRRVAAGRAGRLRATPPARAGLPVALTVTAAAVALTLLVGSLFTVVGTQGRFPGNGRPDGPGSDVEFGLNPFTSLRGQLQRPKPLELLRVRGLPEPTYLRALTLSRYVPQQGWQLPSRRTGVSLDRTLPSGLPVPVRNPTATVEVQNVGFRDRWLPLYGQPTGVTGVVPGRWSYDVVTSTAYAEDAVREPRWTERTALPDPAAGALQRSEAATDIDPNYLDTGGVDPRIGRLASALTRRADTPFERVVALNRYFLDPANGYRYSLRTLPGNTGDALLDFLVRGRTGYCEQFASAMAVMLRTVGVPSRVAVGFTAGRDQEGIRYIGTSDAHAWVEAYFTGVGWLPFDPTPLGDGRTVTPRYLADAPKVRAVPPGDTELGDPVPSAEPKPAPAAAAPVPGVHPPGSGQPGHDRSGPDGAGTRVQSQPAGYGPTVPVWIIVLATVIALVAAAGAAGPAAVRALARRRRLARAAEGGRAGAVAAWREVLAESRDRGGEPPGNDTVRSRGRRLASGHHLDAEASASVRTVVCAVERAWYAPPGAPGPGSTLVSAVCQVRAGLDRSAPLSVGARLWPRSTLPSRGLGRRLAERIRPTPARSGGGNALPSCRRTGSARARDSWWWPSCRTRPR